MQSGTKVFFDDLSKIYDAKYIKKYFKSNHIWIFKNISSLEGKKILDIGCGTGELDIEIKKLYPSCKVIGIDISEGMIKKAELKIGDLEDIHFSVGDVHNLEFDENEFDIVINTISFHHYSRPNLALSEIKRVLKPNGKFYLLDSVKDPRLVSFMPWYWDYTDSKTCYSKHLFFKEFKELFKSADFKNVTFKKLYKLFPAVHILCVAEK